MKLLLRGICIGVVRFQAFCDCRKRSFKDVLLYSFLLGGCIRTLDM